MACPFDTTVKGAALQEAYSELETTGRGHTTLVAGVFVRKQKPRGGTCLQQEGFRGELDKAGRGPAARANDVVAWQSGGESVVWNDPGSYPPGTPTRTDGLAGDNALPTSRAKSLASIPSRGGQ